MLIRDPVGLGIAILGWGSLLWDPRDLRVATPWEVSDLQLPLEFSRISGGNRLTLVIDSANGSECPIYFALSSFRALEDARVNLMTREGAENNPENIAIARADDQPHDDRCTERIREWTVRHALQATVWSGFKPNFDRRSEAFFGQRTPFTAARGREYLAKLKSLNPQEFADARRYIENAPTVVRTTLRNDLDEHGWP